MRLFVAAYPTPDVAAALHAAAAPVVGAFDRAADAASAHAAPGLAPRAGQVHLTLLFLGERRPHDLPTITESVDRAVAGLSPIALRIDRIASWPPGDAPSMIVARADPDPTLLEIVRRLAARLSGTRHKKRAAGRDDLFLPHLTLRRFGPGRTPAAPLRRFEAPITPIPWAIDRIELMDSVLKPTGAEHRPLHAVTLRTP